GLTHHRLVGGEGGLRVAEGLRALLVDLLADGAVAQQLLAARQIGLGENQVGLGQLQIGARLVERILERPPVDGEQGIALLHDLAVLEMDLIEVAGDAGADLDRVDGDEAADILVLVDDGTRDRGGNRHLRRRRPGLLWTLATARQQGRQGDQDHSSGDNCHMNWARDHDGCRQYIDAVVAAYSTGLAGSWHVARL